MRSYGILVTAAAVASACSPDFKSGKTQCSAKKECPSGFSCKDDGSSATPYCFENKALGCASDSTFYCLQSNTCWPKPGACSTVTLCATAKHPGNVICARADYHADCNADACLPNGTLGDASLGSGGRDASGAGGALGTGGVIAPTGAGGATIPVGGYGGGLGTGGIRDAGLEVGAVSTGGVRDAGWEIGVTGTGGSRDGAAGGTASSGGIIGTGGLYLVGGAMGRGAAPAVGGSYGSGGLLGTGGVYRSGGATGRGGVSGSGGTIGSALCTGTPYLCDSLYSEGDCTGDNGCTWDLATSTCSGTPWECSTYSSGAWCYYNGCTWLGPLSCTPTPITSYCTSLVGSGTDVCFTCLGTSCCGQLTDCINDPACMNDVSGPRYRQYLECAVNCCGAASVCGLY
jgi:hypothetical protein